ncbi:right-handed parallel beta-helix repeat-containing protein [Marilutibacter alkalisoli]|uniref:Periplasmic copper-binding protein NosD beta helix domain-containing protein n=1 Tax=Marilutibacter alkalisoli TaxID=2591633 RepID=A0A514BVT0_9GAMM|nr:right-handed parallel beta-helix repeat-containing protein [Lysobacter alkalisoli]QDH71415.1 hypothetical protein FKV23_15930 [Lysobacter alkalisoli]
MHSMAPSLALVLLSACAAWSSALASEDYDNCTGFIDSLPATISTQGTWCLRKDLSTGMISGSAIEIAANNVTLDCNHFKLGGLGAGTGTGAVGINAVDRKNVTVRHCSIRGFWFGMSTWGGDGHLVERNTFDSNRLYSVRVNSPQSTIRANLIVNTGGSTAGVGDAQAIRTDNGTDIIDNTISGVAPGTTDASAYGIFVAAVSSNLPATVARNRIRGLTPNGTGVAHGIHIFNSNHTVVRDNDVQGNAAPGSVGVHCGSDRGTARDNNISGFATGVVNCLFAGNIVNSN